MDLRLPSSPVSARFTKTAPLPANRVTTFAEIKGPGCIRHIWHGGPHPDSMPMVNRRAVIRITFDDAPAPHVEAPVGDFFGAMHGLPYYMIDTHWLAVNAWNGYNCYFPMPFSKSARIEFETGPDKGRVYLQVDYHRYPGQEMTEPRRFCARWRREMPTQRYGEEFLMLDADGPGQLMGFVYGVRLIDNVDRWSHGGADNIYIDGDGDHPAFLRGIGGEDTFGTSYGGCLHPPNTLHYAAMPYYTHQDVGEARPAQRLVGYRFFERDSITFRKSIHMRFGCMQNDISATTYWYQEGAVRPYVKMPDWPLLMPGAELPRGACDLPLPDSGSWWCCGPFYNRGTDAMSMDLPPETEFDPKATYDGLHTKAEGSPWLSEGSKAAGKDKARWVRRNAMHGFVEFNHIFRSHTRGVGPSFGGCAVARCVLDVPEDMTATLRLAWDDGLVLRVNGQRHDLGHHDAFECQSLDVPLHAGPNTIVIKLSNEYGSTHGGWCFAFRATTRDGQALIPQADPPDM